MRRRASARVLGVAVALAVAAAARFKAARDLPVDDDELVYLRAASFYAQRMVPGRWHEIPGERSNAEQPPMVKMLYGWELLRSGAPIPDWDQISKYQPVPAQARPAFMGPRFLSAAAGTLEVLCIALVAPLGGLWLALDTYHVQFTSEAYLEAVPGLWALLSIFLFERALRRREPVGLVPDAGAPRLVPLVLAAVALGLSTAGKYPYGVTAGLAILPFLVWRAGARRGLLMTFAATALVAFFVADPTLWPDPVGRLIGSITAHFGYAVSDHVRSAGYAWWQPFAWLVTSAPSEWHPGIFAVSFLDRLVLVAAVLCAPAAWRRRPVWVVWAAVGLAFLVAWPAKWPHYTLLVRTPLAGCIGLGLMALWERVSGRRQGEIGSTLLR
jgi:hypothetical protein